MAIDAVLNRPAPQGLGLDSTRARRAMVERVRRLGVRDPQVLAALESVPRHAFIEPALASRAYEDVALPIGHGQTISRPGIVARMLEIALQPVTPESRGQARVLEVGTGCGYQTAVLAHLVDEIVSIERVASLHRQARARLSQLPLPARLRLEFGDGHLGLPNSAPFHAIVVAAAFDAAIPEPLLHHLRIGARLVAPVRTQGGQRLHLVDRSTQSDWHLTELDTVRFVPMLEGTA